MFANAPVDWSHPRYRKWKLPEDLNAAQREAFFADDDEEIENMPLTKRELRKLCKTTECRVIMFRGNICHKVEQIWPRNMFNKRHYSDLSVKERAMFDKTLMKDGLKIYDKIFDIRDLKRYCRRVTRNCLYSFWKERYYKERYRRIVNAKDMGVPDEVANDMNTDIQKMNTDNANSSSRHLNFDDDIIVID